MSFLAARRKMFEPGEIAAAMVNIVSGISVAILYGLMEIIYFFSLESLLTPAMMDFFFFSLLQAGKNCPQLKGSRIPATKGFLVCLAIFPPQPPPSIHPSMPAALLFGGAFYEEFSLHYNSMYDSIYKER